MPLAQSARRFHVRTTRIPRESGGKRVYSMEITRRPVKDSWEYLATLLPCYLVTLLPWSKSDVLA
jgi:hypothetical protein